ncbi:hypothetical protein GCM10010420_00690 [Streptomyces glaucosporus]|uniref:Integral membrane protein n=1 Tax=Streptomyces glaucosporus TaxID=284044 RepID=A0ABP5UPG2_9ACTN
MSARTTTAPAARRPAGEGPAPDALLRTVLRVDGWSTALFGVVLLAGGGLLDGPLGLPLAWSVPFGVAMLGGAAALGLIAGYPRIPPRLSAAVVAGNALSCAALLILTFSGALPLTGPGTAFMLTGAAVVAVYAGLEYAGRRRLEDAGL